MTKESLDTLRLVVKKIRLIALTLYLLGTIVTTTLLIIKTNTVVGVVILLTAVVCHALSELINKEYKEKLTGEINKNNKKITL